MASRREPVSVVTVFNDSEMRRECLDRSLEADQSAAPEIEYLPIDNTGGAFASAGAALNHGAARARHDYVAFVHQDVYLHSLTALEEAAGLLAADDRIGLLGAVGVAADGRFFGRVRDRIVLLGEPARLPIDVDSVDELLFLVPRRMLEREPFAENAELAWHAYAVEYGLRVRAQGMRVCAVDISVTHNSLTVNLDRLETAYSAVASTYPQAMPVVTPQGTVGAGTREHTGFLSGHRWRYRWLLESFRAHEGSCAAGGAPCVLADIRLDVDELLARIPDETPLLVVNADQHGGFVEASPDPLELPRGGRPIRLTSRRPQELVDTVPGVGATLFTNLGLEDVRRLASRLPSGSVLGFWSSLGYWMLSGVAPYAMPGSWGERRARPLGMRALAR